jgi:hypothetical protein
VATDRPVALAPGGRDQRREDRVLPGAAENLTGVGKHWSRSLVDDHLARPGTGSRFSSIRNGEPTASSTSAPTSPQLNYADRGACWLGLGTRQQLVPIAQNLSLRNLAQ